MQTLLCRLEPVGQKGKQTTRTGGEADAGASKEDMTIYVSDKDTTIYFFLRTFSADLVVFPATSALETLLTTPTATV